MGRRTRGRPAAARNDGQGVRGRGAIRLSRLPARSGATFRRQAGLRPVPEAESVRRQPPYAVATTPPAELRRRGLAERPSSVRCDTRERFRFLGGSATVGERYASRPASRRHERTARPERASRIVPARSAGNARMPLSDRHAPTSQVSGSHRIDAPVEMAGFRNGGARRIQPYRVPKPPLRRRSPSRQGEPNRPWALDMLSGDRNRLDRERKRISNALNPAGGYDPPEQSVPDHECRQRIVMGVVCVKHDRVDQMYLPAVPRPIANHVRTLGMLHVVEVGRIRTTVTPLCERTAMHGKCGHNERNEPATVHFRFLSRMRTQTAD